MECQHDRWVTDIYHQLPDRDVAMREDSFYKAIDELKAELSK